MVLWQRGRFHSARYFSTISKRRPVMFRFAKQATASAEVDLLLLL